jgi:hypothetical protein
MSIEAAAAFILYLRTGTPSAQIDAHRDDLPAIVELGAAMGFDFSAEELRTAFRQEWQIRWSRFNRSHP